MKVGIVNRNKRGGKKATAISAILKHKGKVKTLFSKVETLTLLNERLQEMLPDSIKPHAQVISLEGGVLSIAAKSAVWGNQIHYLTKELLWEFQTLQRIENITAIRCVILPTLFETFKDKPYWEAIKLSTENSELLRMFSESVEDKDLKQAVLALARHERREAPFS